MRRILTVITAGCLVWALGVPGAALGADGEGGPGAAGLTPPVHDVAAGAGAAPRSLIQSSHCAPWSAVSEDVVLEADLDCPIVVVADGVTVDLAGHRAGIVFVEADHVTVTDGRIAGAVLVFSADARLAGVEVRDSGLDFAVEAGVRTVVEGSHFAGNGTALSFFFGDAGTVTGSTFEGNDLGVVIGRHSGVAVRGNRFSGNTVGLTVWDEDLQGSSGNVVEANRFSGNVVGAQLLARNEASGNRFEGNQFRRNAGAGLSVKVGCLQEFGFPDCAGQGTEITSNLLLHNGFDPVGDLDDGLLAVGVPGALPGVTVTSNRALRNADHGIEAAGVTDGGGNLGRANGNPAQCVGVRCTPGRGHGA